MRLVGKTELSPEEVVSRMAQGLAREEPAIGLLFGGDGTWWGTFRRDESSETDLVTMSRTPSLQYLPDTHVELTIAPVARGSRLTLDVKPKGNAVLLPFFLSIFAIFGTLIGLRALNLVAVLIGLGAAGASAGLFKLISNSTKNRVLNFLDPILKVTFEDAPKDE